jgi:TonB family protein
MRRRTDPRSPVQDTGDPLWLALFGFALSAAAFLAWQNADLLFDWFDGEYRTQHDGPNRAKANLPALFSTDDYPVDAIRRDEQGTVAFRLLINRRGRVSECQIVSSSGSNALDGATCRILEDRARFEPARDADGKRIADETTGRIRWMLPDE